MKSIVIIGGGISGLSCLHYLNKNLNNQATMTLLEQSNHLGGTTETLKEDGVIFEYGANGFLSGNPAALNLSRELGLEGELIQADPTANKRFIVRKNQLRQVPLTPPAIFTSSFFNPWDKLNLFLEIFKTFSSKENESVYDFAKRRFGKNFADHIIVPMVKGIYAGEAQKISIRAAFPKIKEIEETYGSLFRYARKQKKQKGSLYSFRGGMSVIIKSLEEKYTSQIRLNTPVAGIKKSNGKFIITTPKGPLEADSVIVTTPAYAAKAIVQPLNQDLSNVLSGFEYAPVSVLGLLVKSADFPQKPRGFGFLYPGSLEENPVLGVLFESDIFERRAAQDKMLLRIMLRSKNAQTEEACLKLVLTELRNIFSVNLSPEKVFFRHWAKAIPQYDLNYLERKKQTETILKTIPGLQLCSNYFNGVSFNDCIAGAKKIADNFILKSCRDE